jgi:uncharacterized protein YndB with AHSA1/START domain
MTTVTITVTVPVSLAEAWRAWADPAELARWWWPQLPDATYDWEPRAGSSYAIDSLEAGFGVRGVFTEVDEPRRLACTWRWVSDQPGQSPEDNVEVTFEPTRDGATLVTVRHTSVIDIETEGSGLVQGWHAVLDRLARIGEVV